MGDIYSFDFLGQNHSLKIIMRTMKCFQIAKEFHIEETKEIMRYTQYLQTLLHFKSYCLLDGQLMHFIVVERKWCGN